MSRYTYGVMLMVVSAAAFSATMILSKLSFVAGSNSLAVNAVRYPVAALVLVPYALLRPGRMTLAPGARIYTGSFSILILLFSFSYLGSAQYVDVGLTTLIAYSSPAWATLLAHLFKLELFTRNRLTGLTFTLAGVWAILGGAKAQGLGMTEVLGISLAFVAALSLASSNLLGHLATQNVASHTVSAYVALSGAVVFPIAAASTGMLGFPTSAAALYALGAAAFLAASFLLWIKGLQYCPPATAALLGTLELPYNVVFSVLLIGEVMTWPKGIGALLILLGTLTCTSRPARSSASAGRSAPSGS
ncbi:MAG: DMT family transporter [Firmicutes bacterium]|nr:DMT family transporter [Bacillota bacterium]